MGNFMLSFISEIAKMILKELGIIVTQFHNSPYLKPFSFVYIELLEASSSCRRLKPNLLDTAKSHYKLTCAIDFLHPLAIAIPAIYRILFFLLAKKGAFITCFRDRRFRTT